jgi:hypothetical protein
MFLLLRYFSVISWRINDYFQKKNCRYGISQWKHYLISCIFKRAARCIKAPACAGSGKGSHHFWVLYAALPYFLHKRLFTGLEPILTWQQLYCCAKTPPSNIMYVYLLDKISKLLIHTVFSPGDSLIFCRWSFSSIIIHVYSDIKPVCRLSFATCQLNDVA